MLSNRYTKKFYIKTLGCKTNQIESEQISGRFIEHGFERVFDEDSANIYVVNSCSVTSHADDKSLALIKAFKKKNPTSLAVLTGCFAQLSHEELKKYEFIDFIIGNGDKFNIPQIINSNENIVVNNIFDVKKFNSQSVEKITRTRATIKIQDGCNNRCSYCTIPLARGNSRSDSIDNIKHQVDLFLKNDYKEIILTGIHIGQWGEDFASPLDLVDLLTVLEEMQVPRYRLGSLNISELDEALVDFLSKAKGFCPHFHLSLQNTLDKTLKNMNRGYTFEETKLLVDNLNKKFDMPFLGSDFIVGFPGESEADFAQSLENLKQLELSNIHIFPYSKRPDTKAIDIPCSLTNADKQKRAKLLRTIAKEKHLKFATNNINTLHEVLIQNSIDKKSGLTVALTRNYINVLVDIDKKLRNTLQTIKITEFKEDKFYGEIVY